jgi:tetratricopeptide (TPR) repeat protein
LHQLAILESDQGNPSEARRLLARSSQILESLGDQRGLSASLHELARIESAQGNPSEARRLFEQSIRLKDAVGDIAGKAASLCMLAQLEAMEGRFDEAIAMASQAVRDLEARGYADAEKARGVLRAIEQRAAGGGPAADAGLARWLPRLQAAIAQAERAGTEPPDTTSPPAGPAEEVIRALARSAACFRRGELEQCDTALAEAADAAARATEPDRTGLLALVAMLQQQREQAESGPPGPRRRNEAVRLYTEGMARIEAEQPDQALPLFEASLAASRQDQNPHNVAMNLLAIGQSLLLLGRAPEAADRLREGLDLAGEIGEEQLVSAFRTILTVARQEPE